MSSGPHGPIFFHGTHTTAPVQTVSFIVCRKLNPKVCASLVLRKCCYLVAIFVWKSEVLHLLMVAAQSWYNVLNSYLQTNSLRWKLWIKNYWYLKVMLRFPNLKYKISLWCLDKKKTSRCIQTFMWHIHTVNSNHHLCLNSTSVFSIQESTWE